MKKIKLIGYAWKEIVRCKSRSFAVIIAYSLAIFLFSIITNIFYTSGKELNNILSNTGTHFIAYKPLCCGLPYIKDNKQNFITNDIPTQPFPVSFITNIRNIPEVLDVSPFILYKINDELNDRIFTIGGFDNSGSVASINTTCSPVNIIQGKFLAPGDSGSVLLEESFASINGMQPGQDISIYGFKFRISGIVNTGTRPARADVYMKLTCAEKIIGKELDAPVKDIMNVILIESANAYVHTKAMIKVKKIMGESGLLSGYSCYKPAQSALNINRQTIQVIFVIIFLFIVIFSVNNQYSSLNERQRDFGILSAIGWPGNKIIKMILLESLILVGISGIISLIIYSILLILPGFYPFSTGFINPILLFMAGFISILLAAITAAFIPSWLRIRHIPVKYLRIIN